MTGWMLSRPGAPQVFRARVPGCVHTDLLYNDVIDDPFYRGNEDSLRWIEREDWEYHTTIEAGERLLAKARVDLVFEGLDTYATVFLNDSLVLNADNMFRTWRVPCRTLLKTGVNTVRVRFASAARQIEKAAAEVPYRLPETRAYARKAPYHFGWDFGPRFVTSGIWRPVYVETWDLAKINHVRIIQERVTEKSAFLSAIFEIESIADRSAGLSLAVGGSVVKNHDTVLAPGKNPVRLDFVIDDPVLWWTNGLGKPFLYDILATLSVGGNIVDHTRERVGIRTVEIVQQPDSAGSSFFVRLNGVPVFMKGANYVPQDNFVARATPESYRDLIRSAVDANMNMLRVWGGGIYEEDLFYDLCDENGLLVWQDFMFAGTMYPGDSAFVDNVRREAIDNVIRLRNHPCIALWCGNNEVDNGWKDWGWQKQFGYTPQDSAEIWQNYKKVFHGVLPEVVEQYDQGRFYWPSSPLHGWGHRENLLEGDSHYWGVWWGGEPFEVFDSAVGRFMSEYGFQSLPGMATIRSFTEAGDRSPDSVVMRAHQKNRAGFEIIEKYMQEEYGVPDRFEDYVYVSQLLQADGVTRAIAAHRRAMPFCMGTLYWQLNDCWPAVSWSSRDYRGRWKALHYFAKKVYNDVLVSAAANGSTVGVFCVSDRPDTIEAAQLSVRVVSFDGDILLEDEIAVVIPPKSSRSYYVLEEAGYGNTVMAAGLSVNGELLSRDLHYFAPARELAFPEPGVRWGVVREGRRCAITITTEKLARGLYLDCDSDGFFSDNYFDLLPGESVVVYFTPAAGGETPRNVRVRTLADAYR